MMAEVHNKIMESYRIAYEFANKRPVEISYRKGWFRIVEKGFSHNFRAAEVFQMTSSLLYRASRLSPQPEGKE